MNRRHVLRMLAASTLVAALGQSIWQSAEAATSKTPAKKASKSKSATRRSPRKAAVARKSNGPDVKSNVALVLDRSDQSVLFSRKADEAMPIASITKLMTALVVLDGKQPLDEIIEITAEDRAKGKGAFSRLAVGTRLSRGDLLNLALMSSENRAAHAVGRSYPGGEAEFVRTMNLKAHKLGMTRTWFVDPSGLSSENVASATDLTHLVIAASDISLIREYSTCKAHAVKVGRKMLEFHNTNVLVNNPNWGITVQKTGYIEEAGRCLVMQADVGRRPVIFVLLDSYGKYTRVADAQRIRQWMATRSELTAA